MASREWERDQKRRLFEEICATFEKLKRPYVRFVCYGDLQKSEQNRRAWARKREQREKEKRGGDGG